MARRATHLYRIPIALHRNTAKSKARINYVGDATETRPIRPTDGAQIVEVLAGTYADAYRRLCEAVRPNDRRPILGKCMIKYFVVRTPVGQVQAPAPEPMPAAERRTPRPPTLAGDLLIRSAEGVGQALVAKYRPRCLQEVLAQADVVASLQAFAAAPFPCAMLFAGESGTGKTSAAYALAYELGVAVEETELGGLYEVASGSQSTDAVRKVLELLRYRPLAGSGWRVLIVNECDRMALPCETIWLDGLEHLPPKTVVIFTTNDPARLSTRFRSRCEEFAFRSETGALAPWIAALARRVWEQEVGDGEPPAVDMLGMPTLAGSDEGSFNASFRLALQQLQKHVRAARTTKLDSRAVRE